MREIEAKRAEAEKKMLEAQALAAELDSKQQEAETKRVEAEAKLAEAEAKVTEANLKFSEAVTRTAEAETAGSRAVELEQKLDLVILNAKKQEAELEAQQDKLDKIEKEKGELKKNSGRLLQEIELLKTETERFKTEAEAAVESPWESEDFEGLSYSCIYEFLAKDLVPAQAARLGRLCIQELNAMIDEIVKENLVLSDLVRALKREKKMVEVELLCNKNTSSASKTDKTTERPK